MTKPIHVRAKEKAEKSKHYATARQHAMNAVGYFGMFLGTVVIDHIVDEWKSRKSPETTKSSDDTKEEDDTSFIDRLLAGF